MPTRTGGLSNPQTLGRYGYVGNNPVTATDAYGYAAMVKIKGEPNIKLGKKPVVKPGDTTPKPPKGKPAKPHTPKDDSEPAARHGDTETLLAVLDTIGTVAGFAAWLPGPQQPVLAALAAIAGAAAAFTRCSTGGINADCLVDVAFAALGPIGRGMKAVIGPIVKQALSDFKTVTNTVKASKPLCRGAAIRASSADKGQGGRVLRCRWSQELQRRDRSAPRGRIQQTHRGHRRR